MCHAGSALRLAVAAQLIVLSGAVLGCVSLGSCQPACVPDHGAFALSSYSSSIASSITVHSVRLTRRPCWQSLFDGLGV